VEVLPFAAALTPRHMRSQCLEDIAICDDSHLLALTFLETKLYSHDLWEKFVDNSISVLLSSTETEWDAEWLRELHLFLVVASDAERAASVSRGIRRPDGVAIFFRNLAGKSPSPIAVLIKNYAEQDAAAAFRVAALCNLDLMQDLPEVVIENCDQPPFLAIALERASRAGEDFRAWACLFTEAGLRSAATAISLANRERYWQEGVRNIPREDWWSFSNVVTPSFYTDCLAIAVACTMKSQLTPLLQTFRFIPSPNKGKLTSSFCNVLQKHGMVIFFILYMLGPASYIFLLVLKGPDAGVLPLSLLIGFVFLSFTSIFVVRAAARRATVYLVVINLEKLDFNLRQAERITFLLRRLISFLISPKDNVVHVSREAIVSKPSLFCPQRLLEPVQMFLSRRVALRTRPPAHLPHEGS
jgi:hypothetical protein